MFQIISIWMNVDLVGEETCLDQAISCWETWAASELGHLDKLLPQHVFQILIVTHWIPPSKPRGCEWTDMEGAWKCSASNVSVGNQGSRMTQQRFGEVESMGSWGNLHYLMCPVLPHLRQMWFSILVICSCVTVLLLALLLVISNWSLLQLRLSLMIFSPFFFPCFQHAIKETKQNPVRRKTKQFSLFPCK